MTRHLSHAALTARILALSGQRVLVAIIGAPGSGKSTLATQTAEALNRAKPGTAALLAMDGFHYDDAVLKARGLDQKKGAPDTFDVAGLYHLLTRLKGNAEPEVAVPVFDRALEIARAGAAIIPASTRVVLVEGNYLMLDRAPWDRLAPLFDLTLRLEIPEDELRSRLTRRWENAGLPADEVRRKVEENDLPNGRLIGKDSLPVDFTLS
ncbi:nucleoside/nucleotide kinase family protein [Phaeovulum sp.]|uniref:nucleoside/nucleotide kinase family protein n=1 Tax=Phaeovulum sp. TaxID=2934796 RepID=UPI0039E309A0